MRRFEALLVLVLALAGARSSAQTLEDVLRRHAEARGGLARLRSVQTLRLTGIVQPPGLPEAPIVLELMRPGRMRTTIGVGGHDGVRAFDGTIGWVLPPIPGERPRLMDDEDLAEARAQADVDLSPLIDPAAKGYGVELIGRDRLPAGETFRLRVRGGDLPERILHLDVRSHLVVRTEERRSIDGRPVDFVTEVGDYRQRSGLAYPHRLETGPRASAERQRLVFRLIEVNPPIDAGRFSPPSPPEQVHPDPAGGSRSSQLSPRRTARPTPAAPGR